VRPVRGFSDWLVESSGEEIGGLLKKARLIELGLADPSDLSLRHSFIVIKDPESKEPEKRVPSQILRDLEEVHHRYPGCVLVDKTRRRLNDGRVETRWDWIGPYDEMLNHFERDVDDMMFLAFKKGPKPMLREMFGWPEWDGSSWEARRDEEFSKWASALMRSRR